MEGLRTYDLAAQEGRIRVVAFDLPAHGQSPAVETDIVEITKVIVTLADSAGPLAAAIGHSFGGVCLANAIRVKLKVGRLVLFSTPSSLSGMIDKYCRVLGIGQLTTRESPVGAQAIVLEH